MLSEFRLIDHIRRGNEGEAIRRINRAARLGVRVLRVLTRMTNLCDLHMDQEGFGNACDRVVELANGAGMYVCFVFGVDMNKLSRGDRQRHFAFFRDRYARHPGVIGAMTNEPYQNGWSGALDSEVLEYAKQWERACGHRDFIIGDAKDGDTVDASNETIAQTKKIAAHCNILVIHSSRKGGAAPEQGGEGRLRRHIDHAESFVDVVNEAQAVNPIAAGLHEEDMGIASQRWVPIPGRNPYEREYDPDCVFALAMTCFMTGMGFCLHYISEQDDGLPGSDLIAQALPHYSPDPSFSYRNDSWGGSATNGFEWRGGKVRSWVNGQRGLVLAYGHTRGKIELANGYQHHQDIVNREKVHLFSVVKK